MKLPSVSMLHTLKPFQCPHCNSMFSSKDNSRPQSISRFPRLLTCNHSACEHCLQSAEKKKSFSCTICQNKIDLSGNDFLSKLLPDIHALGIISANVRNSLPSIKVKMVPTSSLKKNQESQSRQDLAVICGHCNSHSASLRCDECELHFCSICFKENHLQKSKKKHEGKKIFAELYNSIIQEGCPEHENKTIEFYCEVDEKMTCSYCMLIGDHLGHEVKTLADKNKSCGDDLKNALRDIADVEQHLKYTDHLLCEEIPKQKVDISDNIKSIHGYFHKLHAALQAREVELIAEITEVSQINVNALEEMRLAVTRYESDLTSLKRDAESVIENPCLAISAPALLKKLKECRDIPVHLVPLSEGSEKDLSINLKLDEELEKNIKDIGEIHFSSKSRFTLLPTSDLPENFNTDIPESFMSKFQANFDSESVSASCETFSEDSLLGSSNANYSHLQASMKCRDFSRMQPEKVIVSYIKDPTCFYVQRCAETRKLRSMSDAINRWCKSSDSKTTLVDAVETGDLYLVKSKDKMWYRGRVKSICSEEISTEITIHSPRKMKEDTKVVVFFIDIGHSETVLLSNIKNILARFLNLPGVAKECSLVDILPADNEKWSEEAIECFEKFVDKKTLLMKVYEEMNNVFQVDLCQVADNDICNDVPVSVRDALVFLEFGVFPGGYVKPARKSQGKENDFMPPEILKVNSKIPAIVSHVNDPSHFYIQQMSTASYLAHLIYEMGETYNDEDVSSHHEIYAPRIGMACAAQFTVDKQWYRARVLSLPGRGKVEVQYIDFGNKEVIDHSSLRKLFNKFFKLNVQAIPCRLANVTYSTKCWSDKAKEWLTNTVSRKQLTLQCTGIIPGEKIAEVILYYNDEEFDYCINVLMVEERLASSTKAFSNPAKVKRKKPTPATQPVKTPPKASSSHFKNASSSSSNASDYNSSSALPAPRKYAIERNHTAASSSKKSVASSPSNAVAGPSKSCDVNSAQPSLKSSKKKYPSLATPSEAEDCIEVHVSYIVSPGLFYFRIAGATEEKLKILMSDLQAAYQNRESAIADCCVGKAYAVYSAIQKKWLRGAVLSELPDDSIKIHFIDFGSTEVVEKKFIQELDEKFTLDDAFSVQSHLAGIVPAGGSSEWAGSACDVFHRLAESHETLLLAAKGEFDKEKKSLPSDLLIENLIVGGALEATKIECRSITAELIKMGLVLPIRRSRSVSPLSSSSQASEQEVSPASLLTSPKKETLPECIMLPFHDTVQAEIPPPVEPTFLQKPVVPPVIEMPLPPSEPTFRWKPAVTPMEAKFKGYVTNISEDGNVQLYTMHEGSGQVETISRALQFKYSREEDRPLKSLPPIGEACIAKFYVDQKWYRAEVIDVYPEYMKVKVNFVDYGNNEIVPLSAVRTDIIMRTFPRLCLDCSLHGINMRTDDQDFLTFLHSQLVETIVSVEIMDGKNEQGCLPCVITSESGIDIAELMRSMFEDSAEDSETLPSATHEEALSFAKAQVLKQEKIYPICITEMSQDNVYLQILKFPEPQDSHEQQQNETYEAFKNLIIELKKDVENFPVLKNPKPGMPCCAKYSYDEEWYRCEVVSLIEDDAVVLFVDYGNVEKVKKNDLRELKSHFIEFPIQLYICKLFGLKPIGSEWDPEVKKQLMSSMLYAQVMSSGEISHVELLKKEGESYDSAYEDLITNCLIVANEPDTPSP